MKVIKTDVAVIGAGSAGLCAAIQAAKKGAKVMLFDENSLPGGQLFKQIHKFFGSREHRAGTRGFVIGNELLEEVKNYGVNVMLDTVVYGIFDNFTLGVVNKDQHFALLAKRIIIATGAQENYVVFPGSTLPGVMGAGAAQTMINVNRVLPGKKILMVGSGNVGLIVSYQLLQAGAEVVAVVEAMPQIGGYGVHASKIRRAGVPIYVSHTIEKAHGDKEVQGVRIVGLDKDMKAVCGTEKELEVDTICLAVGLNPMTELAWMLGCEFQFIPALGGHIPLHNEDMETTISGIYVAGDITGVEEASSAMEEGNLAGIAAAESLGYVSAPEASELKNLYRDRLKALRTGPFGEKRRVYKEQLISVRFEYDRKNSMEGTSKGGIIK